jgi:hypothetical protein
VNELKKRWAGAVLVVAFFVIFQGNTFAAPGPVDNARATLSSFQAQFVIFDQGVLEFSHQIRTIVAEVLNARHLLDAGKGNLNRLVRNSVDAAIDMKQLVLDNNLTELQGNLEELIETLSTLIGQINALCPPLGNKIDAAKCALVLTKLNGISGYLAMLVNEIDLLFALLEDGDEGENPTNPDTFDDADDWLEFCLDQLDMGDQSGCNQSLGKAYSILQEVSQEVALVYLKKKYIAKNIWHVQKLLLSTGAPRVRKVNLNLDERVDMQVFAMNGQLIYAAQNVKKSAVLERASQNFTAGVYLYVARVRDANGQELREVNRFIVRH